MVITAGTRNHFALDLGLDREDPSACLDALSDGVELRVDLGMINGTTFVNNASFGAYAEVVQSPAYRGDKLGATLHQLPDLLKATAEHGCPRGRTTRRSGCRRRCSWPTILRIRDVAGLTTARGLDRGMLGVIGVEVRSTSRLSTCSRAGPAAEGTDRGGRHQRAEHGSDPGRHRRRGRMMSTPVTCTIAPISLPHLGAERITRASPAPRAR